MDTTESTPQAVDDATAEHGIFKRAQHLFQDRLELERIVALSSARVLFVARDVVLKRRVTLRIHFATGTRSRLWFERETELLAELDHPSIRPVYSAGYEGELAFRVSKWIEGESLREAVERGPRPIPLVLQLARDLMSALDYAHSKQIVLRRIIPATVMLSRQNRAIVTDLRYANRCLAYADPEESPEADSFLAPETWHGHAGEPASDIYTVGALLYYSVTGQAPEPNPQDITPPSQIRPNTPTVIEQLIMRALRPDPRDRYLTAADMAEELASHLGDFDTPVSALAVARPVDPVAWEKRLRRALGDEYELLDEIGVGGFGSVYRVRDLRLERDVALKVLHPWLTTEPSVVERFRKEAQLAAQLSHPNIVNVFGARSRAGLIWYTMAYVAGVSLARLVQVQGPLPLTQLVILMDEALDALQHAHGHGVVHRDLKPENVLIDRTGSVRITDFGLAMALQVDKYGGASSHSGTPEYAAPEQLLGEPVDHRADLYSLSATALYALIGRSPFGGGTVEEVLARQAVGDLPDVRSIRDDVPDELIAVLSSGAARNPDDRPPSAAGYAEALRKSMRGWKARSKNWLRGLFRSE